MHGHRSGPYGPNKMPKHSLYKMPKHRSGPCKSRSGASKYTNTGPARAKCAATGTPAKPRFDELDLAGSDAAPCQALPPRHRHRKLHLPPNVPVNDFWAVTLYDTQTRSQLQTSQKFRPSEARPRGSRRTRTGRMTSIS